MGGGVLTWLISSSCKWMASAMSASASAAAASAKSSSSGMGLTRPSASCAAAGRDAGAMLMAGVHFKHREVS